MVSTLQDTCSVPISRTLPSGKGGRGTSYRGKELDFQVKTLAEIREEKRRRLAQKDETESTQGKEHW